MKKLPQPKFSFSASIDACIEGITGNNELLQRLINGKSTLVASESAYLEAANGAGLHSLPAIIESPDDPHVIGGLSKSDLVKIYDQYFVPNSKPGRRIYDDLFNAAREECPFCGGIGIPKTLDHYLPKAKHPSFGVLPINLIPCCRDCNMGEKGQFISDQKEELILQPYIDNPIFFVEQWISAKYTPADDNEIGQVSYYVNTPPNWTSVDRARAENHFHTFDLAHKYSIKAAQMLGTIFGQINNLKSLGLDIPSIQSTILNPGITNAPFINHWHHGLYQAISNHLDT